MTKTAGARTKTAPSPPEQKRLTYVEISSNETVRENNRDTLLELIRSRQPVARADLARLSGLQPSTVSSIVDQLLDGKWVVEGAVERRPRGRRPTMLSINADLVTAVADIRPRQAFLAVVDFNGRVLDQRRITVASDPKRSLAKIADALVALIERHPTKTFEGVGISLPGRVDPKTQRLALAPNLPWVGFDIKATLEKRLHLQVELDNDANACLLSEVWFGRLDGVRSAVLVSLSEGIGTAILANGRILSGMGGLAGEFGHISLDPHGMRCGCGLHGCWETFASSTAALRYYKELAPQHHIGSIQQLLHEVEEGNVLAEQAVRRQALYVGQGLRMLTAALSPEVILITGALTTCWDRFGPLISQELQSSMLAGPAPIVEIATGGEIARLRGAAATVLQRHSGYTVSKKLRHQR